MKKYQNKPVVIEAIQWTNEPNNFTEILEWSKHKVNNASPLVWGNSGQKVDSFTLQVETLEGIVLAQLKDYIIKGVKGEFYPCKPDIFEMTYSLVSIPLTDEQYENLGFTWNNKHCYWKKGDFQIELWTEKTAYVTTGDEMDDSSPTTGYIKIKRPRYVHELQALYSVLMGTELTESGFKLPM